MKPSGDQQGVRRCADEAADVIFLAKLSERMRLATDANELFLQGAQAIGRHLDFNRCAFTEVLESDGIFTVYPDYRDPPGLRSAAGSYALSTYPSGLIEALKKGQVLSVSDTSIDALTAPLQTPIYQPLEVRAFVSVPLLRNGRLAGTLSAGRPQPHDWGTREIALLQALGEHVWNALEARRLNLQLRESESRFRRLASLAPVGIFETDAEGNCLFVNETWCELTGLTPEAAAQRGWVAALHPGDRERVFEAWYTAAATGGEFSSEYRFCTRDGKVSWVQGSATSLRTAEGQIKGYIGTVTDITSHKLGEQRLADVGSRLQLITNAMPALISYVDAEGRYQFNNRAYSDWFGVPEQLAGRHMREVLGDAAFAHLKDSVEAALAGTRVQFESAVPYGTGTRFVHADYVPDVQSDGSVSGFYALITDISARKQAEEHTLMLLREVSHRAKNMLAVVQALARETARDANPQTFVKLFSARLTGLGISHDQLVASDWRGVDVRELIDAQISAVRLLETSRVSMAGPPLRVSAAAAQILGMAIHELAVNALQFGALSNDVGRIEIGWEIENRSQQTLTFSWRELGGPYVVEPEHKGFGHTGMKRMVELGLNATINVDYTPTGLEWSLEAPARGLLHEQQQSAEGDQSRP